MLGGPDRWRFYRLVGREAARSVRAASARLTAPPDILARVRVSGLIIAPHDLRTSDATFADDIYAGLFVFAGRSLAVSGGSPFDYAPPSPEWAEVLYGFGWLRHLRAADTALARANARAFVADFMAGRGDPALARPTPVAARRLISFLSQSPLVLEGADRSFYQNFLRSLGRAARELEHDLRQGVPPPWRLLAAVALCYAGLCCDGIQPILRRATRILSRELDRQIMADGGHRSRDPRFAMELLLDLLPLRQSYLSRSVDPPEALLRAIDRMLPLLRLLRHADASLSHFNGMGATAADHLATLLVYDGTLAQPLMHAPLSGYERLEGGRLVVVADVGAPPPLVYSRNACAGCLSFEMSSGPQRIVVNCGLPESGAELRRLARSTPAHSTASVADDSSSHVLARTGWWGERLAADWICRRLGPILLHGPAEVKSERFTDGEAEVLAARHDGFVRDHGVVHERRWRLIGSEGRLEGEDAFLRAGSSKAPARANHRPREVAIRFHLHPSVVLEPGPDGGLALGLPLGEVWDFRAEGADIAIEESVYFAGLSGARRTDQIALHLSVGEGARVSWSFTRRAAAAPAA
ncbi:heparinase II/III family protein [Methylobacterium oxalidis]|uniref:Heparinase n=1 Tax=Methylobacterium oxalidis TaxID=944322 RepID=A0A512J377_9HYPH|nr:heparinase II/III family protein [Methylobacterium oxalidis]GEP04427.1 heparinase [Methylobacterium oxalidis]GJE35230.1 FtsZ-localized protein C [Methylobacterium oxalidis]GLS62799.1 heparinase [Methylobacterium oxalidis]